METEIKVTLQPSGRSVFVLRGTILLEAVERAGSIVETPCGGAGKCGKCLVRVVEGNCPPTDAERSVLSKRQLEDGYRLACQSKAMEHMIVEIPQSSLAQSGQRILTEENAQHGIKMCSCATMKKHVILPPTDRGEPRSDAERLKDVLGPDADLDLSVLRALPHVLRGSEGSITVTIIDNRVAHVEAGDTAKDCHGMAFDIGTTTIVGTLVSLVNGEDKAVASTVNPQTSFGDDVVSRIKKCREDTSGLERLRLAVVGAINGIIEETLQKSGVGRDKVCRAVFAGNTTMQEILCGINPMALGELPFVPVLRGSLEVLATEMGIDIGPGGTAYIFPNIGGFVGGDTVAGILATRMTDIDAPALLVDVGTNGEIVLSHEGRLTATSVAAGPAFEGARIVNGMRAANGAIEKVVIDGDVRVNVIGNAKPAGLCGTGLVDAVASLLDAGVIDPTGRIVERSELSDKVPDAIKERVIERNGKQDFVLVRGEETVSGEDLCLYQRDVRELQLANGAIRAGINILVKTEGLECSDLGCILLAGAFGNFIRRNNAKRMGMLPNIPTERIRFVGNTASFGAKRVLLSALEQEMAARIATMTRHIDLSMDPQFQAEFSSAMVFPE